MQDSDDLMVQLHRDYETAAEAGWRRRPADHAALEAADRLVAAHLAQYEGDFFSLQRPEYGSVEFPRESLALLSRSYVNWLHSEQLVAGEQLLYGQAGFWQHWWNLLHEEAEVPLRTDMVAPDIPGLNSDDWIRNLRFDILDQLVEQGALSMRLIIPPSEPDSPLGRVADQLVERGFSVRVRSSSFLFAVYCGRAAVLAERDTPERTEGYFLTRRPSIVAPLQRVFDDHWASAVPWESFTHGTTDVLHLMSLGWTDARIAESLGLSMRTVSRRVAEAMAAAGVVSRFELGISFAESRSEQRKWDA